MLIMILGLIVFLAPHAVRIVADGWRTRCITRIGLNGWKIAYSVVSIIGFVLLVYGFGLARHYPQVLYFPAPALRHANEALVLLALIVFVAARVPRNHFKATLHHPQSLAVLLWAVGHLLVTGMLHDVVLFGAFGLWGLAAFLAGRARDRAAGTRYPAGTLLGDVLCIVGGSAVWALFAFWLHGWLIGTKPFG